MTLYRTIVADPLWRYTAPASNKRAEPTYQTMTLGQLVEMPVNELADDDAHLWLWVTNAMIEEGHRLARAWGFKPINIVTWCKPGPGVGYYVRTNTERCARTVRHAARMGWDHWGDEAVNSITLGEAA